MYKSDASAPEILLETEAYSEASDVWSAGYIILEMLLGQSPWSNDSNQELSV